MDKEQKIQAISKLLFELTLADSQTTDLDLLLNKLFEVLRGCRELEVLPKGAVLLRNPRGRYFQVAQYGLPPIWNGQLCWDLPCFATTEIVAEPCVVEVPEERRACAMAERLLLLPLHVNGCGIGYGVLGLTAGYRPQEVMLEFFGDLARVLASIVQRTLANETLRIREPELEEARADALRSLGTASEYRDNETGWHIMRMTNYAGRAV